MASLGTLKLKALESTQFRQHTIKWEPPYHGERNSLQTGYCIICSAWVQVNTLPLPNQIDIGGPAVALNCPS